MTIHLTEGQNAMTIQPFAESLLPAHTFKAWRVLSDGTSQPFDVSGAKSLDEAIQTAGMQCKHKDWLSVLHLTPSGKGVEHVCYIKQGKPTWVRKPGFAHAVQIKPLEIERKFSRQMGRCIPVEMFRAVPGADVVGHDFQEVRYG